MLKLIFVLLWFYDHLLSRWRNFNLASGQSRTPVNIGLYTAFSDKA